MDIEESAQAFEAAVATEEGRRRLLARCAPAAAELVRHMAATGEATDACLAKGCLPLPVHYYSPVPDIAALRERGVFQKVSALAGLDFRPEAQEALLLELGAAHGRECDWPLNPTPDPLAYHSVNCCFGYGCAASLYCMIRQFKPRRVIESGSGYSSRVILQALDRNRKEGRSCDYTIIDPFPQEAFVRANPPGLGQLLRSPLESTPLALFDGLEADDILFIDSSHVVKTGGDVTFAILEVLPRLAPGVIVHFHDIDLPYEYPEVYFTNPAFRMFWTEAYLLQAFLCQNREFEVLLAMKWLMLDRKTAFARAFARFDPALHKAVSGSFWIRRRPG